MDPKHESHNATPPEGQDRVLAALDFARVGLFGIFAVLAVLYVLL